MRLALSFRLTDTISKDTHEAISTKTTTFDANITAATDVAAKAHPGSADHNVQIQGLESS